MPWHIAHGKSGCSGWAVVKDATDETVGCHPTKSKAQKHLAALYANESNSKESDMAERAPIPMVPMPQSLTAMMAHLTASLPGGHAKAEMTDGTDEPSMAKLVGLHAEMHGAQGNPDGHNHPVATEAASALPRDNLVRALLPGYELRAATDEGGMPTMVIDVVRFNEWAKIDSAFEGTFMERVAPESVTKTFEEDRAGMRVLFQHGHDPQIGDKVLGPIDELVIDATGGRAEVPLLDTTYNRDLLPGLERGLYGSSFRFQVTAEDFDASPKRSDHNPDAIPERTIREMRVREFGPVTFPAYAGATAGIRSLTDEYVFGRFTEDPQTLTHLIDYVRGTTSSDREAAAQSAHAAEAPGAEKAKTPPSRRQHLPRARRPRTDYLQRKEQPWRL